MTPNTQNYGNATYDDLGREACTTRQLLRISEGTCNVKSVRTEKKST